jgi:hypothetical protein
MKRYIFVDTSAWIALADKSDQNHHRAQTYYEQQIKPHSIQLLTSDYVLDETLTLIRYHMGLIYARTFWQSVQQAQDHGSLSISRVTEEVWLDALALFFRYHDQQFSFTDCTSFVLLARVPVDAVFSSDKDFLVAGFSIQP